MNSDAGSGGAVALHRLYHPTRGDHLYTTDEDERASAVESGGYYYEGSICRLLADPEPGATALLRLDGRPGSLNDHYYTSSPADATRAEATRLYQRGYAI